MGKYKKDSDMKFNPTDEWSKGLLIFKKVL